jgi:hypothetical protein
MKPSFNGNVYNEVDNTSLVVNSALETGISYAEFHLSRQYMSDLSNFEIDPCPVSFDRNGRAIDDFSSIRLYRITRLVLDKEENTTDKLASVYGAIHSIRSTLTLLIKSTTESIEFYVGIKNDGAANLTAATAGMVLQSALKSNFPGSEVTPVKTSQAKQLMSEITVSESSKSISSVAINPSLRNDDKDHFVQGLEKFMDAFSGKEYTAFMIAEPLDKLSVEVTKRGYEELYSTLSHFSETTLAYGRSESKTITENISRSFSEGINNGVTKSNGGSRSQGTSSSESYSSSSGSSGRGFFGSGWSESTGSSSTSGSSNTQGTNWSDSVTSGTSRNSGDTTGKSVGSTTGETKNITIKHTNRTITSLLDQIDEQLDRISSYESYGMWACGAYFVSSDIQTSVAAANTFRALVLGDETRTEAFVNTWGVENRNTTNLLQNISIARHPIIRLPEINQYVSQGIKPTSFVSGKELPILLGFPRYSLKGLIVNNIASFGRSVSNLYPVDKTSSIRLGCIMHKGVVEDGQNGRPPINPVELNIEEFTSHCFITGSTGSGKSNTTYHLLESVLEHGIKFLVIEPKKGEYKSAFGELENVNIFWTNRDKYSFLRLNPFSFPQGIHILEHLDRLIEIFSACWPLHNAMPAILKSATEHSYVSCGWDLLNSRHFNIGKPKFPTFSDLLFNIKKVIYESDYSAQAKGDYTGALETRVSSLTNGIMGQVFTSGFEIEDKVLFDENTIIDLSRVGASETTSLIMGIIVMKLNEYRISSETGSNSNLKHITVIEEAHNLLRRTSMEQSSDSSNVAGKSVEMISNSIAEMRTYGEGFFIVDQSPTAVDVSAIKNTNTKIVMRLPERSDIEVVGNAFSLDTEQINEIARLSRGVAIVSQSGWIEPVMAKIDRASGMYEQASKQKPNDSRCVFMPFIRTVFDMLDKQFINDKRIRDLLREKDVSPSQSDELFRMYKYFVTQPENITSNQQERALFAIRTIGCKALTDIYPFCFAKDADDELIRKAYIKWRNLLCEALDEYAVFDSTDDKRYMIQQLVIYKAYVEKVSAYAKLINVMKR